MNTLHDWNWEKNKLWSESLAKTTEDIVSNFTLESLEQKIDIWDESFVSDCLLKSVSFQMDYFAEKWSWITNLLVNKSLNTNEIMEIIDNYNVEPMAKWSLMKLKFIGFLSWDTTLQKIESNI